jgi:hypothetical protein
MTPAALLHATLKNLFAEADCVNERGALLDGVGDRLFQVDVLARGDRIGGDLNVPVVRRRDEYSVDLLVVEDFAVVEVRCGEPVGSRLDGVAVGRIDVAYGDDLVRAKMIGGIEQIPHPATGPNNSYAQSVACTKGFCRGEGGKAASYNETTAIGCIRLDAPVSCSQRLAVISQFVFRD